MTEFNKSPQNNPGNQKQFKPKQRSNPRSKQSVDLSPYLKAFLDDLAPAVINFLNEMADSQARMMEAKERRAKAIEKILETLPEIIQQVNTTPKRSRKSKLTPRKQELLDLIKKLRDEDNLTLEQVADYLAKNKIPTFSGRGRWHAQTVHRLYMYPPC